jgi:hypothetical protein
MTQISEINGIRVPANELPDRGNMAANAANSYIPYTALTKGELELALYDQQLAIYAAAFPENQEFAQARKMVDSALKAGLSNGVKFVGALHSNYLQYIAKTIDSASRKVAPASKGGLVGRTAFTGINSPEFQLGEQNCYEYAAAETNKKFSLNKTFQEYEKVSTPGPQRMFYQGKKQDCRVRLEIQDIVNQRITNASHHVLYYGIKESFPAIKNSTVVTKHLLHTGGIFGLSNATEIDTNLIKLWTETSILKKNTQENVGPIGSLQSSFNLSPDFDQFYTSYNKWNQTGVFTAPDPKKDKIGEPLTVAAVTALIVAITGAVSAAAAFQKELNAKRNGAMSAAQNYGTPALEAKQSDWNNFSGQNREFDFTTLALIGAGAYLLLSDEK